MAKVVPLVIKQMTPIPNGVNPMKDHVGLIDSTATNPQDEPQSAEGDFGELELETPRERKASFEPKFVAKRLGTAVAAMTCLRLCAI